MKIEENGGRSPLHDAALANDITRTVELLNAGANPNARDDHRRTPLHLAAQSGGFEAIRALTDRGATVDAEDALGVTPLFLAVENSTGDGAVIELLRFRGANPHHVAWAGQTPVKRAREITEYDVARFFGDIRTLPNTSVEPALPPAPAEPKTTAKKRSRRGRGSKKNW